MKQFLLLSFCSLLISVSAWCGGRFTYVSVMDATQITGVYKNSNGNTVTVTFKDPNVTAIFAKYVIYDFYQAFPSSGYAYLRDVYTILCDTSAIGPELKNYDSTLFSNYEYHETELLNVPDAQLNSDVVYSIYPNPVNTHFNITGNGTGSASICVVDITGKVLHKDNVSFRNSSSHTVPAANLSAGYYFVIINDERGMHRFRIVK
jgi:hypothetical protein